VLWVESAHWGKAASPGLGRPSVPGEEAERRRRGGGEEALTSVYRER